MNWLQEFGGRLSGSWHLAGVSLRRLVFSRQTVICVLLLGLAALAVFAWSHRHQRTPADFVADVLLTVYVSFLLPMFSLSFASAGISSDREEQTLVYLLTTPLPRPWIFAAKSGAALFVSLCWTIGSLALLCFLAGKPGTAAFQSVWRSVLASTVAYVALFQLFSVIFRRATIVSLGYSLFLETLVANMPGIVKRLTICYYARCMIFESFDGLAFRPNSPFNPTLFQPLAGTTAECILYAASGGMFLAGLLIFSGREY